MNTKINTLVLFDVDGTLIDGKISSHKNAFRLMLKELYNIELPKEEMYSYEGTTDQFIVFDVLTKRGIPEKDIRKNIEKIKKTIISYFSENIKEENLDVLPGIANLLGSLKGRAELGIITGNLEEIALIKLKRANLERFFKTGGYAEDGIERRDIVKAAIRKAEEHYNKKFEKIVVIGDTTHDIEAAEFNNIITIGVATGIKDSIDDLKKANPNYVFKNFKDYKKAAEAILNG